MKLIHHEYNICNRRCKYPSEKSYCPHCFQLYQKLHADMADKRNKQKVKAGNQVQIKRR